MRTQRGLLEAVKTSLKLYFIFFNLKRSLCIFCILSFCVFILIQKCFSAKILRKFKPRKVCQNIARGFTHSPLSPAAPARLPYLRGALRPGAQCSKMSFLSPGPNSSGTPPPPKPRPSTSSFWKVLPALPIHALCSSKPHPPSLLGGLQPRMLLNSQHLTCSSKTSTCDFL